MFKLRQCKQTHNMLNILTELLNNAFELIDN